MIAGAFNKKASLLRYEAISKLYRVALQVEIASYLAMTH